MNPADPALPLLRAPPFPGVDPAVAAISGWRDADTADDADVTQVIAAMCAARVGGTFWAPPPASLPDGAGVLRPRSVAETEALLAAEAGAVGSALVLLPAATWAARAARLAEAAGATVLIGEVDPWAVLAKASRLVAGGDDEWLLLAHLHGVAAAATTPGRFVPAAGNTIADVVRRALIGRVAYRDCFTGAPVSALAAIAQLADWRATIDRNRSITVGVGIAWWKRREIKRMVWAGRAQPFRFMRSATGAIARAAETGGGIALWPSRGPRRLPAAAAAAGVPLVRVEDGFVRSAGLGSDLHPPCSIVVDREGIYYDPSGPSDLETILQTAEFTPDLLARAEALRAVIVRDGIGKYGADPQAGGAARTPGRVLVAGQVQDDLSVRLGGAGVRTNLDLLRRARAASPDAELWFRPHPDVDAGHRPGAIPDTVALQHADRVVRGGPMAGLLDQVEMVHVLTSLTGFEALLRGCDVFVHGHPFYAGWGLTHDLAPPLPRRSRRLTLPMLVAGVLILYPRYLDPVTGLPTRPEVLIARLAAGAKRNVSWLIRLRQAQGRLRLRFGTRAR